VGTIWQTFGRADVGLIGYFMNSMLHIPSNYALVPNDAWFTLLPLDMWHWTPLLVVVRYAGLRAIPDAFYQAAAMVARTSVDRVQPAGLISPGTASPRRRRAAPGR